MPVVPNGITPLGGNIYLSFQGVGFGTGKRKNFDVMVGDNPPTITGGYANYTSMKRPLQRSLTIFTGYDPMQMNVDIRFGVWDATQGWLTSKETGAFVEDCIDKLEWMAGSDYYFQEGPAPVVYIASHSANGGDTDLIPPQYAGVPWIIVGLQWGKAWRSTDGGRGYRVWQEASLSLQHYLNLGSAPAKVADQRGSYFVTTAARNTPLTIAGAPSLQSPTVDHFTLARRICRNRHNNPCKGTTIKLDGKHVSYHIRVGVPVFVPTHTIN